MLQRLLLLQLLFSCSAWIRIVNSHEESDSWSCESDSEMRLAAQFRPGLITVDGHADDWKDIEGSDFSLLPALDPDDGCPSYFKGVPLKHFATKPMPHCEVIRALHDGNSIFFLLQVDGDYKYTKGESNKCPSIALMFQIGDAATYHSMGGCVERPGSCTNKTCKGHEVDIMHFSIGNAIPGRLYGGNPLDNGDGNGGDRFGHLVDLYAWNPHCRYLDGTGPSGNDTSAQNNWKGTWWHSSFNVHTGFVEKDNPYGSDDRKGTYYFEFSRPLRTMDRLQQDAQFTIAGTSKMSVAFWYPEDGNPWHGSGHYAVNCDWVSLDIFSSNSLLVASSKGGSGDVASAFALLFAVISLCLSVFVGYRVAKPSNVGFIPMENL